MTADQRVALEHDRKLHHVRNALNTLNLGALHTLARITQPDGYAWPNGSNQSRGGNQPPRPTEAAALRHLHENGPCPDCAADKALADMWDALDAIEQWAIPLAAALHHILPNLNPDQLADVCRECWRPRELRKGLCDACRKREARAS